MAVSGSGRWFVAAAIVAAFALGRTSTAATFRSDRNAKQDFTPVNADEVLDKLADLRVEQWSYKGEPGVRHVGPMAQDFHAAFNVGADDRAIANVDANGVTIAAIQSLHRRLKALEAETKDLRRENDTLRAKEARSGVF